MTVHELEERLTFHEFIDWVALFAIERDDGYRKDLADVVGEEIVLARSE